METAVASATEPEDTVRILKDIRDEIRHARDELRAEIRGVRTERVDRPERSKTRTALVALGFGVALLGGVLILWRPSGQGGRKDDGRDVGQEVGHHAAPPVAISGPPVAAPRPPVIAPAEVTPQPVQARIAAPTVAAAAPTVAAAAPKRVPARHKVRSAAEAELEEPAKL